ncbi:MAG: LmbE family protein [Phage 71_18]|nr:MAG: LmbE family protein [Phage 71_18]
MDPVMIVSPHLDDAVLSCGQFMAGRPDVVVVSLFTGTPNDVGMTTSYDRNCGFSCAVNAMAARRAEDRHATARLAGRSEHLGFVDHQYEPDNRPAAADLATAIARRVDKISPDLVLAPAGLGHPDHLLTAEACRLARDATTVPWHVYEELPYRVLFPEVVPGALALWGIEPAGEPPFLGTGPLEDKTAALDCYASQLWALHPHAVRCPERFWTPPCA